MNSQTSTKQTKARLNKKTAKGAENIIAMQRNQKIYKDVPAKTLQVVSWKLHPQKNWAPCLKISYLRWKTYMVDSLTCLAIFLFFFRIPQLYMLSNTVGYNILNKICSFRFVNEDSSLDSYWALGQLDFVSYTWAKSGLLIDPFKFFCKLIG